MSNLQAKLEKVHPRNLLKSMIKENILKPLTEEENTLAYEKH